MELIEIEILDVAAAIALTLGITQAVKMTLDRMADGTAHKFTPLIALVAAALSVAVLADLDSATQQDIALATIVVALTAIGAHSGTKNLVQGVRQAGRR